MRRVARFLLISASLATLAGASLAGAADPVSALKGHDSDAPIDVNLHRARDVSGVDDD